MTYFYSAKDNKFYPHSLKDSYMLSDAWPDSGVDVNEVSFQRFINPPYGKTFSPGLDGYPTLIDLPPLTREQRNTQLENQRDTLLQIAKNIITYWQTKLMLGRISEDEKDNLVVWMDYIDAVLATDINTASDVAWPVMPKLS